MRFGDPIARALAGAGILVAAYFAYRAGGGASAAVHPPQPASRASTAPVQSASGSASSATLEHPPARGAPAFQVKMRLNEMLDEATVDVPSLDQALVHLRNTNYFRFIRGPWTHPSGAAASVPMAATLVVSKSEIQYAVPLGNGTTWAPHANVWNMNEGSFDMREGIFAPSPATLRFRVKVPENARLDLSPALLQNIALTAVFTVSLTDAKGQEHELEVLRVQPGDAKHWFDEHIDLGPYGGQTVELRLKTATDKPQGEERHWTPPPPPPPKDDDEGRPAPPPVWTAPSTTMALALWGNPQIVERAPTHVPYNVLWIVIDALRPDVLASFHDDEEDARKLAAKYPPLDALLPKIPGVTPNLDALAARGVRFIHAYSAAAWTRPGTISMLTGARSSELGIDTLAWLIQPPQLKRWYSEEPPLISLLLRKQGVLTRGVVNNFFMTGYAQVALDFGFEGLLDHRYRTRDTENIEATSIEWLKAHKDERFFLFCNFNSPHDPYEPPPEMRKRIPPPPRGPKDHQVGLYVAEAAKDDAAIGEVLRTLDELDLRKDTIIVVTADHGETLSQAHQGQSYIDEGGPIRFHHANAVFEETTKVPILLSLPGVLDGNKAVKQRVRNIDLAPTILELEGLPPSPKMSGTSLMSLVRGEEKSDRVVVSEGRSMRAILEGRYRYIVREGQAESVGGMGRIPETLFDLEEDPGERHSLHLTRPDLLAEMRGKLSAAMHGARPAPAAIEKAPSAVAEKDRPTVHLRFAGAGESHKIAGAVLFGDGKRAGEGTLTYEGIGTNKPTLTLSGNRLEIALTTSPDEIVGIDLHLDPPTLPLEWSLTLDGKPWPEGRVFVGPFGLAPRAARLGLDTDEARDEVYSPTLPEIDVDHDLGLFVTRDRRAEQGGPNIGGDGAQEFGKLLEEWGYARGGGKKKKN